jgi:hypothetical protein
VFVVVPGPFFGFVGGWVIDSGWFQRPILAMVLALAATNFAWSAMLSMFLRTWIHWSVAHLYPVAAWWLALALDPETERLLNVEKSAAAPSSEVRAANSLGSSPS